MESNQSRFYNKVFYVYLLDEIALLIQFLYDFGGMIAVEITFVVILVATLAFTPSYDAHALHEIARSAIGLHGIRAV